MTDYEIFTLILQMGILIVAIISLCLRAKK